MEGRALSRQLHVEYVGILVELKSKQTSCLNHGLLRIIKLANQGVQCCQCLVPEHAQVVRLSFIEEKHAIVLEVICFLSEGGCRVLQLCLQFEDVFTDLEQQGTLEEDLRLAGALAGGCFEAGLTQ